MDIERPDELIAYLRGHGHLADGEEARCRVLEGGVSNRTVLVERWRGTARPGDWVVKQALAQLRVAVEWFSAPERIHREAAGMRALGEILPPGSVPTLVFEDHEHHLLGMTAVPQPHSGWRDDLLAGRIDPVLMGSYGELLGRMHCISRLQAGRYARAFADASFFESLRLEPYYLYTATQRPEAAEFLQRLCDETRAHRQALVHGDYSPKNLLVHRGKLVVLDHEVIHWGDPAFDVGFAFSHLLSKANHLPVLASAFAAGARAAWATYGAAADHAGESGFEARCQRHLLACLLARVDGRSPLGYLSEPARTRQRAAVLSLIPSPPAGMPALIHALATSFEEHHADHH